MVSDIWFHVDAFCEQGNGEKSYFISELYLNENKSIFPET